MKRLKDSRGFTFIEIMIAFAIVMIVAGVIASLASTQLRIGNRTSGTSTANRVVASVRSLVGSPPALRNSVMAMSTAGASAANQNLLQCTGGIPANACHSGTTYPLTLYYPIVMMMNGAPVVIPLIEPNGSRFDNLGMPCSPGEVCPLIVSTTFTPQCGPAAQSAFNLQPGNLGAGGLAPVLVCTVADIISVNYTILLDSAMASQFPELSSFANPGITGNVATSVLAITNNQAQ